MNLFSNIGALELLVILILALLVVGPERLPQLARDVAKVLRNVRRAYENLSRDLGPEIMSIQQTTEELRSSVESIRTIPQDVVTSIVKAADLGETVDDLKSVAEEISQTQQTMATAAKVVTHPVGATLDAVRRSLEPPQPQKPEDVAEGTASEGADSSESEP
jgi:sec-independent protein translocase protein TatB